MIFSDLIPMTTKTLLGFSLALVMLMGSVPFGFSDSLKSQLDEGLSGDELQCKNHSHVLVLRTNGNFACVTEKTAERMNWNIVKSVHNSENDASDSISISDSVTAISVKKQ